MEYIGFKGDQGLDSILIKNCLKRLFYVLIKNRLSNLNSFKMLLFKIVNMKLKIIFNNI